MKQLKDFCASTVLIGLSLYWSSALGHCPTETFFVEQIARTFLPAATVITSVTPQIVFFDDSKTTGLVGKMEYCFRGGRETSDQPSLYEYYLRLGLRSSKRNTEFVKVDQLGYLLGSTFDPSVKMLILPPIASLMTREWEGRWEQGQWEPGPIKPKVTAFFRNFVTEGGTLFIAVEQKAGLFLNDVFGWNVPFSDNQPRGSREPIINGFHLNSATAKRLGINVARLPESTVFDSYTRAPEAGPTIEPLYLRTKYDEETGKRNDYVAAGIIRHGKGRVIFYGFNWHHQIGMAYSISEEYPKGKVFEIVAAGIAKTFP